jgi:hypothetical protein
VNKILTGIVDIATVPKVIPGRRPMNRDELLALCNLYVRRRGLGVAEVVDVSMPPTLEIVDSYLHAEISESEKNSLLAYVRGGADDTEDDDVGGFEEAILAELDDLAG